MLPAKLWTLLIHMLPAVVLVSSGKLRFRRDLLDLADMFELVAGLDPSEYAPYGNWCGYGGQGKAIDLIDECCQVHDDCYGASEKHCLKYIPHVVEYVWRVNNGTIECKEDSKCGYSVCKCDKEVVECIIEHNHHYNEHHRYVRKPG
ncbi:phospholipase A2 SSD387 [Parasteatoda tepidariorum]|uniref:phospholipase A2 SSD387 n=1 Tax=Parasteatoda tepidariorum TaxID=114398 RepID=UPI00077F9D79|nr:phospholipase A2 SSD387 isoform X2 [Parasteatoda tepidariorum]